MDDSELSVIRELLAPNSLVLYINEIFNQSSSSSSSSSEESNCEEHQKVDNFVETIDSMSNADLKSHLKLQRPTVEYLISTFQSSERLPIKKSGGRLRMGARKSVYLYLCYISNTVTYRQLGNLFGIAKSSAWTAVHRVTSWLLSIAHEHIKWPQGAAAEKIKRKFELKQQIPNILGAIDCTHVEIKAPRANKEEFFDRKKNYSLVLQAVVDPHKRFIDITCGEPRSLDDCRVLRRSNICISTSTNPLRRAVLLGDSAYPSTSWLVTPFKDNCNLMDGQKRFNHIHSSTRMVVENAFGLLKGRFRRLSKFTEQTDLLELTKLITSACVLHNIVKLSKSIV